ncbi:unnamed protein product [Rotaria sp. Silwood2]|nr:unnamed protein product [Rotaria sp. Silwood2]CAF3969182.1 unnamed protein product [Rotaria sp. Silwood2]
MNGTTDSHDMSTSYYIGNNPIKTSSNDQYPSTFTPNVHMNQSCLSTKRNNINSEQTFKPLPIKPNNFSQHDNNNNNIQKQQASTNLSVYNFENDALSSTAYYDHIHAQVRTNIPIFQHNNSTSTNTTNSTMHHEHNNSLSPDPSRQPTPAIPHGQTESTFLVIPAAKTNGQTTILQPPISTPSTFTPIPMFDYSLSNQVTSDDDPPLDYLHYSMDSLIRRLVPTDSYIPKQSFIYPMLLCSRMNIRPSLLFNQLARLTIKSIANMTHDRSIRTMNNFLYVLSQWTRTFPYDFRNSEMMSQIEDLFKKITSFESTFQSDVHYIYKKLRSKLKALDNYEEYIRQLNKKAMTSLNQSALVTDIINECSTPILFAQQLTHIELDRLRPVGAEELIQYFIMKLASEEVRAHPNKMHQVESSLNDIDNSNNKSKNLIHDKKLTFCLEAYIQWFNRLTFFITTEIVKHTQRRSRVRLINYFIDAAYECFRIQNFNSMIGILGKKFFNFLLRIFFHVD